MASSTDARSAERAKNQRAERPAPQQKLPQNTVPATRHEQNVTQWWVVVVAAIALLAGLRAAASVLVPFVFAIFFIAVFWPLQSRLERRMPRVAAMSITLLAFLAVAAALAGALYYSGYQVVQQWPQYREQFSGYYRQLQSWGQQFGVGVPNLSGSGGEATSTGSSGAPGGAQSLILSGGQQTAAFISAAVLVVAFFLLGLLEVDSFGTKLRNIFARRNPDERRADWWGSIRQIAKEFQRYVAVDAFLGVVTGVLVYAGSLLVGLELAFVWALANFVLNFIPTLGSIVAVVPPVLFALVQFQSWTMALLVLLVIGGVQVVMGMVVGPLLQGKYLELSATVVLLSVIFWGWLWGIVGALIAVPLMILIVIVCSQFERTQWVARLLLAEGRLGKLQEEVAGAEG